MPTQEKIETLLTVKALSEWISVSQKVIYRLVNNQKIPYIKIGGKYLFEKEQILAWLKTNSVMVLK